MNIIFVTLILISISVLVFVNPAGVLASLNSGAAKAVSFALYMLPIYAVWLGVLELMEKSKLTDKLAKLLKPVLKFLFGNQPEEIQNLLAQNIAGNLIGVGAVSTPSGIEVTAKMQGDSEKILSSTIMLIILNSSSLQLIPTTLLSLRTSFKSTSPESILLPCFLSSTITTIFAVCVVKLFSKFKRKKLK